MTFMTKLFGCLRHYTSRRLATLALLSLTLGSVASAGGTFTATGSLSTARYWATGTLLPNGKVLVVGGSTSTTGPYTATAEVYDPATGIFSATGSLGTARGYHSQLLLPNGKVLILGGTNGATLSSTELYDPSTGSFSAGATMLASRYLTSLTLLPNGKVLVAGGWSSTGGYLSSCEIYDPATGTFTATGSMATARRSHVAILLSTGKVLVAGGSGVSGEISSAEIYNPATGTWSTTGSMTSVRRAFSGTLLPSGKALITDGYNGTSSLTTCELYDPVAGTWSSTASTLSARTYHSTTLLASGKALVFSGAYGEVYDPATGTYGPQIHAVATRNQQVAVLLPSGKVLIAGGINGSTVLSAAELFDPQASGDPTLVPSAGITAPASVTAGAAGLTASVPATAGATYEWSIAGGTITGGQGTNALTFTAGSAGTLSLTALVTSSLGIDAQGSAAVNIVAPPDATITATSPVSAGATGLAASVPSQSGASYAWNISGGTITAGQGTNQITYSVTASAGGTFVIACAVTNGGLTANGSKSVFVSTSGTGTFTATGSLSTARYLALGTMLPNGKVLVVGGQSSVTPATYLSSAEVYDPAAGTWSTTGSMITPRSAHGLALLSNGKVLVAGGSNNGSYLSSAEVYDPVGGTWSTTGSMAAARWYATMTALPNGKVLMAGGYNASGGNLASCELYDPATGTWSATGSLNTARRLHTAVLLSSGKVLVIGGYGTSELASAEVYDPAAGTWSTTGSMASVRRAFAVTVLPSGKVLVADGWNGASSLATCEIYDPAAGTFSAASATGAARSYDSATLLPNGKAVVYGLAYGEVYDPATGGFGAMIHAVTTRSQHVAVLLPNGKVLIAGGVSGTTVYAAAEVFDPQASADPTLMPNAAITAPVSVTAGTTGLTASVPASAGATYEWSINGGTITGGQGTNVLAFTAGSAGPLSLTALVTSNLGVDAQGSATVNVVAAPNAAVTAPSAVTSTVSQSASVPAQSGATYAWTLVGGAITSATNGNSITFTPGAPGTLTLACTVTNAAGAVASSMASASVVALPDATITAASTVTLGAPSQTASVASQSGCTYAWTITPGSGGTVAGPTPANANATTYAANGTQTSLTLSCAVTNSIGYTVTGTKTVTTVAAPVITLFSAAKANLNPGDNTTLSATFSGGTGSLDQGLGAMTSGTPVTITPAASTTYTLTVVNAAGTATTASTAVQIVAAPNATITTPTTIALGSVGVQASVLAQTGCTYAWTMTGGTLVAGAKDSVAYFTPTAAGTLTLQVTVTNAAGLAATGSASISVVSGPAISRFTPGVGGLTVGGSTTLTAVFTGGTATIDHGVGSVTSGTAISITPAATTTYTLTVTNAQGVAAKASLTVSVVPAPVATITAPTNVTASCFNSASVPVQASASYAWSIIGGTASSATNGSTFAFTPGASGTVNLSCQVTNAAGATATGTKTAAIFAVPTISAFTAAQANIPSGGSTTLTGTFAGGTGSVSPTVGSVTSGTSASVSPAASTTYTLTVTNAAGSAVSSTRRVVVYAAPNATVTAPAAVTANQGGCTASVPAVEGSTFAWSITGGTITAGAGTNAVTFTAGTVGTLSLQCTVTNPGNSSATGGASASVVAAPNATITAPSQAGSGQTSFVASVSSQSGCTYAWSLTGGAITSGATTNSIAFSAGNAGALNLTCTVSNAAGTSATGSKSVTVYQAPDATITAPDRATTGSLNLSASVPTLAGATYAWTLSGGTLLSAANGPSIQFNAPTAGTLNLQCTVTSSTGITVSGTKTISVEGSLDVSGTFYYGNGSYTRATLYQAGSVVTGGWVHGSYTATITSSTLNGNVVTGTASNNGSPGTFTLTFSADGSSLVSGTFTWTTGSSYSLASPLSKVGLITVCISPTSVSMATNRTQAFTALVAGSADKGLTWSATGGSVSSAGVYVAPASPGGVYTITATSTADATKSASASITASDSGLMDVSGTFYYGNGSYTRATFYQAGSVVTGGWVYGSDTATITAATLSGNVVTGTASDNGAPGTFTLTFSADGSTLLSGTFTKTTGSSYSFSNLLRQNPMVSVSLSPASVIMTTGGVQSFTAMVGGSYNKGISWSATGGTVDANGLYTAPQAGGIYTVTATSQADNTKSASATLTASDSGSLDVSGLYYYGNGSYSRTTLYQTGSVVTGGWIYGSDTATIVTSTLNGNVLTGTAIDNTAPATFILTFSMDGTSFNGTLTYASGGYYSFSGVRQGSFVVQVTPSTSIVPPTWSQGMMAWVGGTYDKRVTWSVQEGTAGGSVNGSGAYTAPSAPGTYHVVATTVAVPTTGSGPATGSAPVTVSAAGLQVLPGWTHLAPSTSKTFTAVINGVPISANWTIQEGTAGGSITSTGGLYVAPATPGTYHLVATSVLDPAHSASAVVVVDAVTPISVSLTPNTVDLVKGGAQTFAATVAGTTNQAVTWTCSAGTITTSGFYTAPQHYGTYTVTATSTADPTVSATATVTVSVSAGTDQAFTYDANGNLLSDGNRTFEWDAENRLVAVTVNGGDTVTRSEFDYDGLGRRVQIRGYANTGFHGTMMLGSTQGYLWDGSEIIEERSTDGSTTMKRFFERGFVDNDGSALFYTLDHLGSIREVTDSNQALRARYDYDPYGRTTKLFGDRDSVFGFDGYFLCMQGSLYLTLNRGYDSSSCRWLSRDPIGEKGGLNLYEYVDENPINKTDPYGLQAKDCPVCVGHDPAAVPMGWAPAKDEPGSTIILFFLPQKGLCSLMVLRDGECIPYGNLSEMIGCNKAKKYYKDLTGKDPVKDPPKEPWWKILT